MHAACPLPPLVLRVPSPQVKAALRRLGSTQERLTVVKATCEFQIHRAVTTVTTMASQSTAPATAQYSKGAAGCMVAHGFGAGKGAQGIAEVPQGALLGAGAERLHFLQHTLHNVHALLDAFASAAAGAGTGAGGAVAKAGKAQGVPNRAPGAWLA